MFKKEAEISYLIKNVVQYYKYSVSKTDIPGRDAQVSHSLEQWFSTFFVRVLPNIISLQLCTTKVVGV
jgi:hypothetical protein